MTGDGAETIFRLAACADPVDMAMAVHDDRARRETFDLADEPRPLISAVPMRSENFATGIGYSIR